ncbi:hypothetical protein B0H13DRAFT_1915781 [Mycena leptocephala]|nr:hypothetical protein B0H13DRAFT_1915781 [Mycena leptocephala]
MSRLSWNRADEVECLLLNWQDNDDRHRVKELSLRLKGYDHHFLTQRNIFSMLDIFSNLTVLTIANGRVTDHIHTSVTRLPHLRELRLIACGIYAFSRSDQPEGSRPFMVKVLVLIEVEIFHRDRYSMDEMSTSAMHEAQLTIFPPPLLAGLISVEFHPTKSYIQPLYWLLPDTPGLEHIIWEPSVLEFISLRFNKCKRAKVTCLGSGPTGAMARAIGRKQLGRMPRLDTFLLCGKAPSYDMTRNTASAYEFLASIHNNPLLEVVAIHGSVRTRDATVNFWTCRSYTPPYL